jgi:hypothetical protein
MDPDQFSDRASEYSEESTWPPAISGNDRAGHRPRPALREKKPRPTFHVYKFKMFDLKNSNPHNPVGPVHSVHTVHQLREYRRGNN